MGNVSRRQDNGARFDSSFFVTDCKAPFTGKDKIEFIGAGMSMHRLLLIRFETIESDHHVVPGPKGIFEEFFRARTLKVMPVEKMIHGESRS